MTVVYVQDIAGNPLPPTRRCGHVRNLLDTKKAKVVNRKPFTIRLLYETEYENKQRFVLGNDPGRTNIGTCVVNEKAEPMLLCNAETRNKDVPKLMLERKGFRRKHRDEGRRDVRQRRARKNGTVVNAKDGILQRKLPGCEKPIPCHYIKNKEAKYMNRKRPDGWLTPTANQLLQTSISVMKKMKGLVPITDCVIEINKFAFMLLDNPNIQKWEFQRGKLYQKGSLHDTVTEQQHGQCLLCTGGIKHFHHLVPKSKGGSDTIDNIAGLCKKHHDLVHREERWQKRLATVKEGQNKKYGALSVLNQIIPFLLIEAEKLFPGHVYVITGQDMKDIRDKYGIPKDHCLDAYCIAASILEEQDVAEHAKQTKETEIFRLKQFRRHDRQACHQENIDRKYVDKTGKVVAINRHKRSEQKTDSLEEYRKTHTEKEVSQLKVKHHRPYYKRTDRIMPGAVLRDNHKNVYTLFGSSGTTNGKPAYYIDQKKQRHSAIKSQLLIGNQGLVFV